MTKEENQFPTCDLCGDELESIDPRELTNPDTLSGVFCSHGIFCSEECSQLFHDKEEEKGLDVTVGTKRVH